MEECVLSKLDISFEKEIQDFREEMLSINSSMDGTGSLSHMPNIEEWIELNQKCEVLNTVPKDWVTAEQYAYIRKEDQKIIGMIQFRHYLNEFLENYGGHIGYSIRPSERRKGYAKKMLSDCLIICKEYGLKEVLITCMTDNEGSKRTVLANGGIYESTIFYESDNIYLERYWITL